LETPHALIALSSGATVDRHRQPHHYIRSGMMPLASMPISGE
jgi:hypothetical protein